MFSHLLPWALVLCLATGCRLAIFAPTESVTKDAGDTISVGSGSKSEPRTIPCELVFIRYGEHDEQLTTDVWNLTDEQVLDGDVRRRLHANGLRVGVIATALPPDLQRRFTPPIDPALNTIATPSLIEAPAVVRQTLRLLPGRENEVLASSGIGELILMESIDDAVRGATYRDASAVFEVRAWPSANGKVRVQVCPVIKHGPTERTWVGDDGVFRLEAGQKRHELDHLLFEATLAPESILLVSCAGDASSTVGDAFCRDPDNAIAGRRLVALRPLARMPDPLFTAKE